MKLLSPQATTGLGVAPGIPPSTDHLAAYMFPTLCIQSSQLSPPQLADGNSVGHFMVGTFSNIHGLGDWMPTPLSGCSAM